MFTMWLLLAVWAVAKSSGTAAFIFATLATLTRPEGALMGAIILAAELMASGFGHRVSDFGDAASTPSRYPTPNTPYPDRVIRNFLLAFVLPLSVYASWKLWYFHNLLPNSFYVKVAQDQGPGVGRLPGLGTMLHSYEGMIAIVLLAAWGVWRWLRAVRLRDLPLVRGNLTIVILAAWLVLLTGFYLFSHLIQPEYYRFANTLEAMLIVLAGVTLSASKAKRASNGNSGRVQTAATALLLLCNTAWSFAGRGGLYYIERTNEYYDSYTHISAVLRTIPNHEQITIAWGDAGRLPYFSGLRHIDPIGLNTNEIAHAHTTADVIRIVMQLHPDLIVMPLTLRSDTSNASLPDSCRAVLRTGDGLIGKSYPMFAAALTKSSYTPIVLFPQTVYDLDVFADTLSPHYRDIIHTLIPRIGHDSDFHPPVKCIQ